MNFGNDEKIRCPLKPSLRQSYGSIVIARQKRIEPSVIPLSARDNRERMVQSRSLRNFLWRKLLPRLAVDQTVRWKVLEHTRDRRSLIGWRNHHDSADLDPALPLPITRQQVTNHYPAHAVSHEGYDLASFLAV